MLVVVVGLVALLPLLATLQYRWIGQLSNGEVERLRSNLQTSAELFEKAVNHEIFPAQFAFRVSFTGSIDQIARELSLNYQYWASHASRPDLIDNIYWIDYDDNLVLHLFKFEPAAGTLEEEAWPAELLGWKNYFIERNKRQLEAYNPGLDETERMEALQKLSAGLMADSPAIPIPVSIDDELAPVDLLANLNATSSGRAGHTLLTLNKEYIDQIFFPELQQEFLNLEEDIDVLVVSNSEPEQIVYKSDPSLTLEQFENPDAETGIARFRGNRFTSASRLAFGYASLIDRDQMVADTLIGRVQRAWQPAINDSFIVESPELLTDFPLQAIIRLAKENEYDGELTAEDLLVALTNLTQEPTPEPAAAAAAPRPVENLDYAWTLRLRHKTGSLEASVAANRQRNLALSFGILLILGIATVMIFTYSRRAQQLADRQLSFVTRISHELRTPLSVIKSSAANLADGVVSNPSRMQKYGQLIGKESSRLTEMVEQILELAGVFSQKKVFDHQPTNIEELVEDALDVCKEVISEKEFEVEMSLAQDLPEIKGDARSLQVALSNLINNAVKYSNGNRWIGIRTEYASNGKGPEVLISVSDKGVGIPSEDLPYIFEDFYRGSTVRKAQIKGNGIGLSIVKKTMEAHNGRVTVQSEDHAGTTFTLHLPVK